MLRFYSRAFLGNSSHGVRLIVGLVSSASRNLAYNVLTCKRGVGLWKSSISHTYGIRPRVKVGAHVHILSKLSSSEIFAFLRYNSVGLVFRPQQKPNRT